MASSSSSSRDSVSSHRLVNASASDTDDLCENCKSIGSIVIALAQGQESAKLKTLREIEESSKTCKFCKLVFDEVLRPELATNNTLSDDVYVYMGLVKSYWDKKIMTLSFGVQRKSVLRAWPEYLDVVLDETSTSTMIEHGHARHLKPASDLTRATKWLKDCLKNHDHGSVSVSSRPSRLIAVGSEDGTRAVHLVNSLNLDADYLALSHCWGDISHASVLRTTNDTLNGFHDSIPWDFLPRTFKDAIQITRRLGIAYLWIDSLCIIQDDSADWDTESAKMASVYNNALVTIMAASSSDSRGGCSVDSSSKHDLVALPCRDANGSSGVIFAGKPLLQYTKEISNGPLFKRAWVLQERLMSKRKLLFGREQIYWECGGRILSEYKDPSAIPATRWESGRHPHFYAFAGSGLSFDADASEVWGEVVEEYSKCRLTYGSDKLPSLSGLARTLAQETGYTYAAGLWLEGMPRSLLWNLSTPMNHGGERPYCAPSWSWASTTGLCSSYVPRRSVPYELEIIQVDIKLSGTDIYGKVAPGSSISVRGRLQTCQLVKTGLQCEVQDDVGGLLENACLDQDRDDLPLTAFCLEVHNGNGANHNMAQNLILASTDIDMEFRRIGSGLYFCDPERDGTFIPYMFRGLNKTTLKII